MRGRRRLLAALLGLLAASGAACAEELAPQSLVDKLRLLGIRAEPPDGAPGETIAVDALIADPLGDGRAIGRLWVACVLGPAGDFDACADPAGGAIVGLGTAEAFTFVAPGIPEGRESAEILVSLSLCAGGTFELPEADGGPEAALPGCAGGEFASGFKRIRLAPSDARNHNPDLQAAVLGEADLPGGDPLRLPSCTEPDCPVWVVAAAMTEASAESYEVVEFGSPVTRTEDLFTSWFGTAGSFGQIRSGGTAPTVEWRQPSGPQTVDLWFVVHDGRGGSDWLARRVVLD